MVLIVSPKLKYENWTQYVAFKMQPLCLYFSLHDHFWLLTVYFFALSHFFLCRPVDLLSALSHLTSDRKPRDLGFSGALIRAVKFVVGRV